jgi:hypothetical protein
VNNLSTQAAYEAQLKVKGNGKGTSAGFWMAKLTNFA